MKGDLHILYPDKGPERLVMYHPIPEGYLNEVVGGLLQAVPMWDQFITFDGNVTTCFAYCNQEAQILGMADNIWATALWHYILRAKGEKRQAVILKGPVIIISGDAEFLENL